MNNCISSIAQGLGRTYITPEDVQAALAVHPASIVRLDMLEILGKQTSYDVEDPGLCAFLAWRGTASETTAS